MSTMNQVPGTSSRRETKIRWPHLLVALLFFVSSFMAGVMVGRSNEEHTVQGGTIFLSAAAAVAVPINVYGRVVDGGGGICPNMTVEWHSEPRYTTTDADGNFRFDNVELGPHVVTVLGEDGKALANAKLDINRDIMVEGLSLNGGGGGYELQISAQVIDIDLMMFLDETNGTLELLADPSYSRTNLEYLAIEQGPEGDREFGGGLFEGEPFQNRYVANEETVPPTAQPGENTPNDNPSSDDEEETGVPDTEAPPTPGQAGTPVPTQSAQPDGTPVPTQSAQPSGTPAPTQSASPSGTPAPTQSAQPDDVTPPAEEPTEEPDKGDQNVMISSKDGQDRRQWAVDARIDLFGKGTKLQPGSQGSYTFDVTNPNSFDVKFQLWLEDNPGDNPDDTEIPLRYRLRRGKGYVAGDQDTWLSGTEIKANWDTLPERRTWTYILEWSWPYEEGDEADQVDTRLGATHDKPHIIKISTYFERTEDSN